MKRRIVILTAALFIAVAAHAKTGVVFIHGKGGTELASPSVARKMARIRSAMSGLSMVQRPSFHSTEQFIGVLKSSAESAHDEAHDSGSRDFRRALARAPNEARAYDRGAC